MTLTLTTGKKYAIDTLTLSGWTGDGEGCNVADYFAKDGAYKGADADGVEPIFDGDAVITADNE